MEGFGEMIPAESTSRILPVHLRHHLQRRLLSPTVNSLVTGGERRTYRAEELMRRCYRDNLTNSANGFASVSRGLIRATASITFAFVVAWSSCVQGQENFSNTLTPEAVFAQSPTALIESDESVSAAPVSYGNHTREACYSSSSSLYNTCDWEVLPNTLLYRSYIAAPHEPRMATVAHYDLSSKNWRWDSTLGGRVGLIRRHRPPNLNVDRWQVDLEGAVMVRLDPGQKMDLESSDYRFGLQWTGQSGDLTYKFGYFHISSHVGDEFLIRNPTFNRINYVRESLVLGIAQQRTPEVRLYGEMVWGFIATGGAEPFQLQYGAEYSKIACNPMRGAPFAAVNLQHHQENDFAGAINILAGWQWRGPQSGRSFRLGVQYFNGPSAQYQFYQRHDNHIGLGAWFDY